MDEENNGNDTSSQQGDEVSVEQQLAEAQEALEKEKEISNNQRIRAEKAEKKPKDGTVEKPAPNKEATTEEQGLTGLDVLALTGAGVTNSEDVDYLIKTAKGFGLTLTEALKDKTIKAKLEEQQEERNTANATNTKGNSGGGGSKTGASILKDASNGKLPESDEDFDKLAKARIESRK